MNRRLALLLCLALQACATPHALPPASDLQVGPSEVVVIGKIELVPPFDAKLEQTSHWNVIGEKRMLNRIWIATGAEFKPLKTDQPAAADFQSSLEAEWGVPFMVKAPRQRTYFNGGLVHLDGLTNDRLWFPGGFYFDVPRDAAAVYIGTLRYYRNDFDAITRVEVLDERRDIAAVLQPGMPATEVRPALLKRMR